VALGPMLLRHLIGAVGALPNDANNHDNSLTVTRRCKQFL